MTAVAERVRNVLHRKGIARLINAEYCMGKWERAYVQTALPVYALALYVARTKAWDGWRVRSCERVGRFVWRWQLTR